MLPTFRLPPCLPNGLLSIFRFSARPQLLTRREPLPVGGTSLCLYHACAHFRDHLSLNYVVRRHDARRYHSTEDTCMDSLDHFRKRLETLEQPTGSHQKQ